MAILTAAQLKDRESPPVTVELGDGAEVLCRRPDLPTLLYEGLLPTPLMAKVIQTIANWSDIGADAVTADMLANDVAMRDFVNRWVCAALVQPRAVMDPLEPAADAVCVNDLTLATRAAIFGKTFRFPTPAQKAVTAGAERFPDVGHGEGAGQDVPEVQPAAV